MEAWGGYASQNRRRKLWLRLSLIRITAIIRADAHGQLPQAEADNAMLVMPQVPPRLPNSSGGGLPPRFVLSDEMWRQIENIGPVIAGDHATGLRSEIERVTSRYLLNVGAAMSAPHLDRRRDQFTQLRRAIGAVQRKLDRLQIGDEGDFATALIERNLSHPDLGDAGLGKLDRFRELTRDYVSVAAAVATACERGRREALASVQTGLQPANVWNSWVRDMAGVCERHGFPTSVRNDELGVSAFVRLIEVVQMGLDAQYRQHTKTIDALSTAVKRALREGRAA
jgi:hypothetical protein